MSMPKGKHIFGTVKVGDKTRQAFYRADTSRNRNTGGTGLGLYIVRKVMEMHRANYGISNINNGVLFWFELPCKQPVDNSI